MTAKQQATLSPRKLEQLRMLADWQLRAMGYDVAEITRLCNEADDRREQQSLDALRGRLRAERRDEDEWITDPDEDDENGSESYPIKY